MTRRLTIILLFDELGPVRRKEEFYTTCSRGGGGTFFHVSNSSLMRPLFRHGVINLRRRHLLPTASECLSMAKIKLLPAWDTSAKRLPINIHTLVQSGKNKTVANRWRFNFRKRQTLRSWPAEDSRAWLYIELHRNDCEKQEEIAPHTKRIFI